MPKSKLKISDELESEIIDLVSKDLKTPRNIALGKIAKGILSTFSNLVTIGFCIVCLIVGGYLFNKWSISFESLAVSGFMIGLGSYGLFSITRFILDLYNTLCNGEIAKATVQSVDYYPPNTDHTLAAVENGNAIGKYFVDYDGHSTFKKFNIDQKWAKEIRIGEKIIGFSSSKSKRSFLGTWLR